MPNDHSQPNPGLRTDLNTSYIFIPFIFRDDIKSILPVSEDGLQLPAELGKYWEIPTQIVYQKDENDVELRDEDGRRIPVLDQYGTIRRVPMRDNQHLFRYIAEKPCTYCHYQLNPEGFKRWIKTSQWRCAPNRPERADDPFSFTIQSVHLYCFRTHIGILAYKIHSDDPDPFTIANQLYHLKNVEKVHLLTENSPKTSFMRLSQCLKTYSGLQIQDDDFFFFAQKGTARANIMTHLETPANCNIRKALYYLRWCYTTNIHYMRDKHVDRREIYRQSLNIQWGISPEAVVCLTIPELGNAQFLRGTFNDNFNTAYLYTYIILLHQKFVLYKFMTEIDSNKIVLSKLEEYQIELSKFENDFVYSRISEVAQYQNFYRRASRILSLREMYEDVHEPLTELSVIQENDRDRMTNRALGFLSILVIFSALVDSIQFVEEIFTIGEKPSGVQILQISCIAVIAFISFFVLKTMLVSTLRQLWHDQKQGRV